jgi:hypothetical protein
MQKIERSIQSLKEKILSPDVKVSSLLREAKIIAYELEDKEILEWIDKELNGYKDDPVPRYRKLRGVPMIMGPNRGWVPISPYDLKILCDDFNLNYSHKRPFPCMLILRLLVPRAIVRKFQKLGREHEIKKQNGEYLEPEALLNKAENLIANKRCVRELKNYKFLMDTAQHSYIVNISFEDVLGAAIRVRVFLEELFGG